MRGCIARIFTESCNQPIKFIFLRDPSISGAHRPHDEWTVPRDHRRMQDDHQDGESDLDTLYEGQTKNN